ncbi:MAG: hypothetical protein PVI92_11330 [Chromatiales bacterium]|jgi:hypothetical protein
MRTWKILLHLLLTLLLSIGASGVVSAKVASGDQNPTWTGHQAENVFNWLTCQRKSDRSTTGPPECSVVPNSTVQANKAAGDAVRDAIAARTGGAIEQNFRVTGGLRRVDVLDGTTAIESKVGRTSLTPRVRQELARDVKLLRSGQVDRVQWEFSPSGVTGKSGPTGPLRQKLEKFGIDIVE